MKKRRIGDAIMHYERAIQADANCLQAIGELAFLYEKQGRFEEAIALWERALELETRTEWRAKIKERLRRLKWGYQ